MDQLSSRCVRWQLYRSTSQTTQLPAVVPRHVKRTGIHRRTSSRRQPLSPGCLPTDSDSIRSLAPSPADNKPVSPVDTAELVSGSVAAPLDVLHNSQSSKQTSQDPTVQTPESSTTSSSMLEPEYIVFTAADLEAANPAATTISSEVSNTTASSSNPLGADMEHSAAQQQQQAGHTTSEASPSIEAATADNNEQDEDEDFLPPLDLEAVESLQQEQFIPPPLIDPDLDIANDPAYTIRLLDILDQISTSSTSLNSTEVSTDLPSASSSSDLQQPDPRYSFTRQPAAFCVNCCTPLDPYRPLAACSNCGHLPANNTLLLNLGVSSEADLEAYPAWQQQQQQQNSDDSSSSSDRSNAAAGSSFVLDTKQLAERLEAGMALRQARQLLRDAGILNLPAALLAYEDDLVDPEPAMQLHRGLLPPNHERPERLKVILARLRTAGLLDVCDRLQPREATDDELLAVHSPGLVAAVSALSHANQPSDLNQVAAHMAPDVLGNRFTYRAARLAAGTAAEMARQLVQGNANCGMALIRPLGHQAGVSSTEGGNYFNSVAVAARAAQAAGARRVMIIDWDVHHCKGTAEIFAEDPNVLVFSLHRYGSGYYPGTGAADHVGSGRGCGRNINVAWCPPTVMDNRGRRIQVEAPPVSDGDYLTAWHMLVLPVVSEFKPDVILVSAGFDAVDKDPLGYYRVHPECFGHLTAMLKPLAPLGLLLEGGYNLEATAACVESCVRVLLGEQPAPLRGSRVAGVTGWSSILRTLLIHQQHWQSLSMLNFLQLATPASAADEGEGEWDDEPEDAGYVYGDDDDESEEYELQEEEFSEAAESGVEAAAASDSEAADSGSDYDNSQELLQQVLQLLDKKTAAKQQQQQQQQVDADELAADLVAADTADDAEAPATAAAVDGKQQTSSSSSSSDWSAGGFMDDTETVDSGTESDDNTSAWQHPGSRTDWGLEQYDEDVTEHLSWYDMKAAQKQLRRAEKTAAEVAAAAAIAGEAAAAEAAEKGTVGTDNAVIAAAAAVAEPSAEAGLAGPSVSTANSSIPASADTASPPPPPAAAAVEKKAGVIPPNVPSTMVSDTTAGSDSVSSSLSTVEAKNGSSTRTAASLSDASASQLAAAATSATVAAALEIVSHPLAVDADVTEAEAADSAQSNHSES